MLNTGFNLLFYSSSPFIYEESAIAYFAEDNSIHTHKNNTNQTKTQKCLNSKVAHNNPPPPKKKKIQERNTNHNFIKGDT